MNQTGGSRNWRPDSQHSWVPGLPLLLLTATRVFPLPLLTFCFGKAYRTEWWGHLCCRPRRPNTAGRSPCRRRHCTCQTSNEATPVRSRWLPHSCCLRHFPALQHENNSVTACYSPETFPARSCCLERYHGNPKAQIQTKIRSPISTTTKVEHDAK